VRDLEDFPHRVREIEHLWIPLSDGCRLAARLWLPAGADALPVPVIIEYIPYGKRIGTRDRDEAMHRWFAGHGIAALRIDLRGSGESEGVLLDEYLPREQEDGVEAIAWVAAQPWCTGNVGLMGKSWGGFNALQIAARRPPHLKAILTVCSTDDRYADDVHYMGGCLLNDSLWWGAVFFQLLAQPPDPALVGPSWRALWQTRLQAAQPPPIEWMRHPLRDEYWKQGSICEDYGAIECAVWAVGGWADGYSNSILRMIEHLRAPRHALIGPWGHAFPHDAAPGPSIGFLQEAVRFWKQHLAGESANESEPQVRVWMQESVPAGTKSPDRPGRWVHETSWPSPRITVKTFGLAPGKDRRGALASGASMTGALGHHGGTFGLGVAGHLGNASAPGALSLSSAQDVGRCAGGWLVASTKEQREDDQRSLCFDSDPLPEPIEILGTPELKLRLTSDRPTAFIAARLCDVSPEGSSLRVSYGLHNLTHSDDHERAEPLVPGRPIDVIIRLNDIAHSFPAGHRIRIALSNAYWPLVWPSPQRATLTVQTGASELRLPERPPRPDDSALRPFDEPDQAPSIEWTPLTRAKSLRSVTTDPETGDLVSISRSGFDEHGRVAISRLKPADIEGGDGMRIETRIHPEDPTRAFASMMQRTELRRGDWRVAIETEIRISSTVESFLVEARLDSWEGEEHAFSRRWDSRIPRVGT
jgi:putative CocE/NonD family hydrolase